MNKIYFYHNLAVQDVLKDNLELKIKRICDPAKSNLIALKNNFF